MQAIFERAYRLGRADSDERQKFYRQLNSRGWKTKEPNGDLLAPETPELAGSVGRQLGGSGLTDLEIRKLIVVAVGQPTPFLPATRSLRAL